MDQCHNSFFKSLPGVLYWHVEALRVNCARFEPGGSIKFDRTVLISNDVDTAVTSYGPVEQVRVRRV